MDFNGGGVLQKEVLDLFGQGQNFVYAALPQIAGAAGVLASAYYWLVRRRPVFTAYSIDVLGSNSQVSSARARRELGFTSRPWQESIHDQVEWFRSQGMLPGRT